jgi:hypothetical protein
MYAQQIDQARERVFCAIFFNIKTIILPRQAGDKHEKRSKTESGVFFFLWQYAYYKVIASSMEKSVAGKKTAGF